MKGNPPMLDKKFLEKLNDVLLGSMLVLFGLVCAASPVHDFFEKHKANKTFPPEHVADAESLTNATDIRSAMDALLSRPDIARIHISQGNRGDYPLLEIKQGKTDTFMDIGSSIQYQANGTSVFIAYFKLAGAEKNIWDELREVQPSASFMLGLILIFGGFFMMFFGRGDSATEQQVNYQKPEFPQPPPRSIVEPEPKPQEEEARKFSGLKLVKK